MEVLFATNNRNKIKEIQSLLPEGIRLIPLSEVGFAGDIPEPYETLEENARTKIEYVLRSSGRSVGFSEDSGLFIRALQGRPGVHSAHYAGPDRNDRQNMNKVLQELEEETNREAFFQTTICLAWENDFHFFTGTCPGRILHSPRGEQGFGYDPIFQPMGSDRSFAEMELREKNQFSHRQKAVQQMIDFFHQAKKSR